MLNSKQILKYFNELQIESNRSHSDYHFDNIMNYIGLDELLKIKDDIEIEMSLKNIVNKKYVKLISCKTKAELKNWLYDIVAYIQKYEIDTETLIMEYFEF